MDTMANGAQRVRTCVRFVLVHAPAVVHRAHAAYAKRHAQSAHLQRACTRPARMCSKQINIHARMRLCVCACVCVDNKTQQQRRLRRRWEARAPLAAARCWASVNTFPRWQRRRCEHVANQSVRMAYELGRWWCARMCVCVCAARC